MTLRAASASTGRRGRAGLVVLALVLAAVLLLVLVLAWRPARRFAEVHVLGRPGGVEAIALPGAGQGTGSDGAGADTAAAPQQPTGPLGDADGIIPAGAHLSPDADVPAIANLDPDLRSAVRAAARDAAAEGVPVYVTSGWRSARYQQRLLDDAVRKYGSEQEARRWVATPDTSAHVTGDAVDLGSWDADDWLQRNGSRYGLCQAYANEAWHFELLTTAGGRCPAPVRDAAAG